MNDPQQPKLDTPIGMKYIKEIAEAFKKAEVTLPPGNHWQDNLDASYYLGMMSGVNLAVTGILNMQKNPEVTIDILLSEFNILTGQLACKIVDKVPKIITL